MQDKNSKITIALGLSTTIFHFSPHHLAFQRFTWLFSTHQLAFPRITWLFHASIGFSTHHLAFLTTIFLFSPYHLAFDHYFSFFRQFFFDS